MKNHVICAAAGLLTVALTPLLFVVLIAAPLAGGAAGAGTTTAGVGATSCVGDIPIVVVLETIRTRESGGNYQAKAPGASASGAYQFIDSTWQHYAQLAGIDTSQYPHARDAPPAAQDAAATIHVNEILEHWGNRLEAIPITWYYPLALQKPELMDIVPMPEAGNTLTPRQYADRWLATYSEISERHGNTVGNCDHDASPDSPIIGEDGQKWVFPLPRNTITADVLDNPHAGYPAIDIMLPEGTPTYALTDGHVATIHDWPHNWWTAGCQHGGDGCSTCGVGLTVKTAAGLRYTYCHAASGSITLNQGDPITAGQHVMNTGNTGRSGAPHLHIQIRINDDTDYCPQPLLQALYNNQPPPAILPTTSCF